MINVGDSHAGYRVIAVNGTETITDGEPVYAILAVKPADVDTPAEWAVWSHEPQHAAEPYNGQYSGTSQRAWTNYFRRIAAHAMRCDDHRLPMDVQL